MSIIIDILALAIIVISVVLGGKRGLFKSVMKLATLVLAILAGWYFMPPLAQYYNNTFLLNRFTNSVNNAIGNLLSNGIHDLGVLFTDHLDGFLSITNQYGADIEGVANVYEQNSASTDVVQKISEYIAQPISTGLSSVLAFLTIFVVSLILLKLLTWIIDSILKLPILKTANRILGFVFGTICGLLYAALFCIILIQILPALSATWPQIFTMDIAEKSLFIRLFSA